MSVPNRTPSIFGTSKPKSITTNPNNPTIASVAACAIGIFFVLLVGAGVLTVIAHAF